LFVDEVFSRQAVNGKIGGEIPYFFLPRRHQNRCERKDVWIQAMIDEYKYNP